MLNTEEMAPLDARIIPPLAVILAALFLASLAVGRYHVPVRNCARILLSAILPEGLIPGGEPIPQADVTVVLRVRLPRAILACFAGAALSISGASFQGMFRNPLVSPDILGVSTAAGFGAALAILLSGEPALIRITAFVFGIAGVILTCLLGRADRSVPAVTLVLSGVVVSALFSALISCAKFLADPYSKLPAITFWLMGGLSTVSVKDIAWTIPPMLAGMSGLLLARWRMNLLSLGDEEARSLGVNVELLKGIVILCSTLLTAASVCVSGMIGWVGLVIPHIGRMLVGPDHRVLFPVSLILGAAFLLCVDDIARTVSSTEIPLGILTALIGAPFFGFLIRKTGGGWR